MTNPNPEGLPSLKLPGGYYLDEHSRALRSPTGEFIHDELGMNREGARNFATAMNTHTDALGAALEFYANPVNHRQTGWQGDLERSPVDKDSGKQARAALEAWGKVR